MKHNQLKNGFRLRALKYPLAKSPHLTIETNRTCNLHCRLCYNLERNTIKAIDDVKKEIVLGLQKRKLSAITLLGGEPTPHPHLPEIVSFIKSKRLFCQLLTNGLVFLRDEKDELLVKLIFSGIDRIFLHVDSGQSHIHKDIEATRQALFSKLEEKKIHFSLALTLYEEEREKIGQIIKSCLPYRYFDGILAVLAREPLAADDHNGDLLAEHKSLCRDLSLDPTTYVPSNLDDSQVCWLLYFYFINASTGQTLSLSPSLDHAFRALYRLATHRNFFTLDISPLLQKWMGLLAVTCEALSQSKKMPAFLDLFKKEGGIRDIRFHFIVIQSAPEFNHEKNRYEMCYHCPDATIRNGMLTPVCVADLINPFDGYSNGPLLYPDLYREVYDHLGELQATALRLPE
jgi:organic radical activating enzyme